MWIKCDNRARGSVQKCGGRRLILRVGDVGGTARQGCCNVSVRLCLRVKYDCGCVIDWQVNRKSLFEIPYSFYLSCIILDIQVFYW